MEAIGHPLRILMSTTVFPRWRDDSTPPFVLRLAEGLTRSGCAVTVLAPHADGAALREQWGGVEIIRFRYLWPTALQGLCYEGGMLVQLRRHPHRRWQLPFLLSAQIRMTHRLAQSGSFDLIHAHSLLPAGFCALRAVSRHGLPVVVTSHGNDVFGMRPNGLYGRLKRWVVREADALTANSSATEEALLELGAPTGRVHRVPAMPSVFPADSQQVASIRERFGGAKIILFVGRLLEEKGVGDLIHAFAQLTLADVQLVILGDGADRAKFEAQAHNLGLGSRVAFMGWIASADLAHYLAAADLFVGPSKPGPNGWKEAQGLVFVEAMAAGTPIIATRCGGIPDMIIDGETGVLVEPGAPEPLIQAMMQLLQDDPKRTRLAACARASYEKHFAEPVVAQKTLAAYSGVMGEKGAIE